ncbi:MAG: hypothetical protein HW380_994 [Magnetococcales bacterium]|nr:hypothetical protein [Magnetococcales bacterium]
MLVIERLFNKLLTLAEGTQKIYTLTLLLARSV